MYSKVGHSFYVRIRADYDLDRIFVNRMEAYPKKGQRFPFPFL